ncbi:rod shape-determining protein MreD [Tropicibacter sp. R16_0]|uniref:rod shape-determining protein MreD n=1 Tax=Tropicibacter sp. R16_0 TaxID=2821102 RepID=UPI001ADC380D|nr:rod shape-determining protein MreD [Tropicibacter sp. R16_0]MBO9450881.1 rod shape-determining protein MreD [Tropicibacter sp. R16_0]
MDNLSTSRIWTMRLMYVGLALVILFFHLLPLNTLPSRWAPPDLLIAFTFAWTLRRPDYVPVLLIAAVMLVMDFMLQRPPGLLSALVVAGVAYLRNWSAGLSDASFLGEWASVGLVLVSIMVLNRLILGLTAVEQAPLWLVLIQLVLTIVIYPLVAFISQNLLGVRKLTPADVDILGGRS